MVSSVQAGDIIHRTKAAPWMVGQPGHRYSYTCICQSQVRCDVTLVYFSFLRDKGQYGGFAFSCMFDHITHVYWS